MKEGTFIYHPGPEHRCLAGDHELHCGDCFQIEIAQGIWADTRIELSGDWFLVGLSPGSAARWHGCKTRGYSE